MWINFQCSKSSRKAVSCKKSFLKNSQYAQENTWGLKLNWGQVFSCEYLENFKNIFFYRNPPVAASVNVQRFGIISAFIIYENVLSIKYWNINMVFAEFEKWLAIRARESGVGGVLAWVAC